MYYSLHLFAYLRVEVIFSIYYFGPLCAIKSWAIQYTYTREPDTIDRFSRIILLFCFIACGSSVGFFLKMKTRSAGAVAGVLRRNDSPRQACFKLSGLKQRLRSFALRYTVLFLR